MAVEGSYKCAKYLVWFFNFIFLLCGLALIVVGVLVQVSLHNTLMIKDPSASGGPIIVIALGVIVVLIAFVGCCGAWKESLCMLWTFAILLTLIFFAQIAAAVLGYIFRGKVVNVVQDSLADMSSNYNTSSPEFRDAVDLLQQSLKCCGVNSSSDWRGFSPGDGSSVPDSCCITKGQGCGQGAMNDFSKIFNEGCQEAVVKLLERNVQWIITAALVIACLQCMGVGLACVLILGIRKGYEIM